MLSKKDVARLAKEIKQLKETIESLEAQVKSDEVLVREYLQKEGLTQLEIDNLLVKLVNVKKSITDYSLVDKSKLPTKEVEYNYIQIKEVENA